jgi:TonB family protein
MNIEDQATPKMAHVVTQLARGNLCLAFRSLETNRDTEAWKKMMGDTPVCTRFDTLPEAKPGWSALLASTIFQIALTALLVALPTLFPDKLVNTHSYEAISVISPQTEVVLPATQPPVRAEVIPTPPPVAEAFQPQRVAKLIAPRPLIAAKPAPAPVKADDVPTLNETSPEENFETTPSEPVRPREPVKTGTLETGSAAPATTTKPVAEVQTGGFGEPTVLPGDSSPKHGNIARAGPSDLLPGPGYGNGTSGASGVRGTVASAGFGDVAISATSGGEGARGMIKAGGFGTAAASSKASRPKQTDAAPAVQPVVILEKPNPVYSDEARKLGIEGEVLVEVIFRASGLLDVVRVTSGLGHGLDDAAVRAAQQIRFKPALSDGKPADFPAIIHIEFQLAF